MVKPRKTGDCPDMTEKLFNWTKSINTNSWHLLTFYFTQIFSGGKAKINLHMTLKLIVIMLISCLMRSRHHLAFLKVVTSIYLS